MRRKITTFLLAMTLSIGMVVPVIADDVLVDTEEITSELYCEGEVSEEDAESEEEILEENISIEETEEERLSMIPLWKI